MFLGRMSRPALARPRAALRRDRRRRHERARAGRALARRDGDRLRPRAPAPPTSRRCARSGSSRPPATTPPTCPRAPRSSSRRAIPPENPERAIARERGQRELHRADLLGELTRLKPTIAITGTHGKTTTSSMVVHALRGCGMDPSYLVGGEVRSTGANAGWGDGGVARRRGRRVRPLAAQALADDRGAHERRARPPHDLQLAPRRRRHLPRVPRARRAGGGLGPAGAASRSPATSR